MIVAITMFVILVAAFLALFYLSDFEFWEQGIPRLQSRLLSSWIVSKVLIVAIPVWIVLPGGTLDRIQVWGAMAVILLLEPLALPKPPDEFKPISSNGIIARSMNWIALEAMLYVKLILWSVPFVVFFWITGTDYSFGVSQEELAEFLGTPERLDESLAIPFGAYLLLCVVASLKGAGAALATRRAWALPAYFVAASIAILSINALSGRILVDGDVWNVFGFGFVGSVALRIAWDLTWETVAWRSRTAVLR